jgi:nucleotide-binding universal stress UspA family protein
MYKTILVPLDGSPRAEKILAHVEPLAAEFGAKVILMQVVEPEATLVTPYDMVPYYDPAAVERQMAESRAYLAGKEGELTTKGIAAKTVIETGATVASILAVADRENVDLVAMASHGRSGLGRVFYGSVAAGVLHATNRPLLLVRAME